MQLKYIDNCECMIMAIVQKWIGLNQNPNPNMDH
jgi:hypothetical protein